MGWTIRLALLAGAAGVVILAMAEARPPQKVTGPVATYWMSVATTSGMAMGAGGRPSMGSMMRMGMGGGMGGGDSVRHDLTLQLGSTMPAAGEPKADHMPGSSPALPLLGPDRTPNAPLRKDPGTPGQEQPRGRMLIYWGCGDHAGPGQPVVLDFTKLGAGAPAMPSSVTVRTDTPPSAGRYASYGEWPNHRSGDRPPSQLAGLHKVKGNYSPDIQFTLPPDRDYMPALRLDSSGRTAGGATLLTWQPIATATGYFASLTGASGNGRGGGDTTIVTWSSSLEKSIVANGLTDYLSPAEVRRLIAAKIVMPPDQTRCAVPAEVTRDAPMAMLMMIAYGEEANFSDPPRPADPKVPWNIRWTAKARYKSTASTMLGMPAMGGSANDGGAGSGQRDQGTKKKGGLFGRLKGGIIPH
jgi:hypothetical protein